MKKTEQENFWTGDFGKEYSKRNFKDLKSCDQECLEELGLTRTDLNKEFLGILSRQLKILEVGCNRGRQLELLEQAGFVDLWGIDINRHALDLARKNTNYIINEGSAIDIPFKDNYFDLVFTSRVLIHVHPNDVARVMDEIYRVSKKYIWGFEYFSEECEEINYRENKNKLWKCNFKKLFLDRFSDLSVIKDRKLEYLEDDNVDEMYLLEKL